MDRWPCLPLLWFLFGGAWKTKLSCGIWSLLSMSQVESLVPLAAPVPHTCEMISGWCLDPNLLQGWLGCFRVNADRKFFSAHGSSASFDVPSPFCVPWMDAMPSIWGRPSRALPGLNNNLAESLSPNTPHPHFELRPQSPAGLIEVNDINWLGNTPEK